MRRDSHAHLVRAHLGAHGREPDDIGEVDRHQLLGDGLHLLPLGRRARSRHTAQHNIHCRTITEGSQVRTYMLA